MSESPKVVIGRTDKDKEEAKPVVSVGELPPVGPHIPLGEVQRRRDGTIELLNANRERIAALEGEVARLTGELESAKQNSVVLTGIVRVLNGLMKSARV